MWKHEDPFPSQRDGPGAQPRSHLWPIWDNGFFPFRACSPCLGKENLQEQHSWHRGCWSQGFSHEPGSPHNPQLPLELLCGFAGRKGAAQPPALGTQLHMGLGQLLADSQGQVELEDKENPGMLGSLCPQHLKAWPDTEQAPTDTELTQDPQPTLCAPSSEPPSTPELLQPHQSMRDEK